ncbi:MAG: efflux RND transporter permease subunit [Planctomycetota bacterium]
MNKFFYSNSRLLYLAVSLILVSGLSSYFILPRMEDPQLVPRGAFIHTLYPGAEPTRVESLVSEKIEDALNEIKEIKELRSTSRESISTIAIELRDEVMDSDRVWSKIRDKLDDVESELPQGAAKPDFEEMDFKAFASLVALRWEDDTPVNYAVLQRWAKELEDAIQLVPGTEKAELFGQPSEEILVTLDATRLASLGLTVADISRQITSADSKVSAGQLRSENEKLLVEVAGELDSVERIEEIPIRVDEDNRFTNLGSIAEISRTIVDPPSSLAIVDGKRSIVVGGFVRPENRIDVWAKDLHVALDRFESNLPEGIVLDRLFDQNEYVKTRLSTLVANLLLGACAVFVVIFVLMGWRSALVVSIALPLAGMMVLFGMRIMDIPIHQMSVTGLIIALGLLIDNAIVIVEEMTIKMRSGSTPGEAVGQSVNHLFLPLLGSTLTTAFAFAPIALMPGPAGEFVGAIAINVIIAIFSSFFLAMTIIPAISAKITSLVGEPTGEGSWFAEGISSEWAANLYRRSLDFVFARPAIGILIGVALPVVGFVSAGQLQEQFFPPADRDQLHIELELSPASSIENTLATTKEMTELLLQDPRIKRVDWFIGESAPAFYYNLISRRAGVPQYAQAMVQLETFENQSATIHDLQDLLDEKFAHARTLVRQLEQGPPFDAPVEVRLFGPDLDRLQELGSEIRQIVASTPGVIHTRAEMDDVLYKYEFDADEERTRAAGLTLTDVAFQMNAATEGTVGGSILETTEEMPIRVRLDDAQRSSFFSLTSIDIINPNVGSIADQRYRGIPVTAIGEFKTKPATGAINHLAGLRMNEIQAYIPAGVLPSSVLTKFQAKLEKSGIEIPPGYALRYGGEAAKRDEAVGNLMASVGILVVLMIATLVLSFGSFRMATIVGSVGILSIGLGLLALWVFGYPFGFMAIVGAMGLMGVAINDTIVVLAAIKDNEAAAAGDPVAMRETVVIATRHIISTSLTTMAGFAPLILGGGGFWPPLAVAIAGGVGGATILALYLAPSAYLLLMCRKSKVAAAT